MKKFLSEYGFAILAAIVVILLIAICSPVSNLIQTKVENVITSFANKTSMKLGSVENGISGDGQHKVVAGMPKKSDLITIDGQEYRVLSINGTQAKVLAMYDANITYFNNYSGGGESRYEGSVVDNYLENTFYPSLSFKDAIIKKDITQNMYRNASKIDRTESIPVGLRHVYLLDMEDLFEYLDNGDDWIDGEQIKVMFYDTYFVELNQSPCSDIWLRSSSTDYTSHAWRISTYGEYANLSLFNCWDNADAIRPAFVIDLSKIDFQK